MHFFPSLANTIHCFDKSEEKKQSVTQKNAMSHITAASWREWFMLRDLVHAKYTAWGIYI